MSETKSVNNLFLRKKGQKLKGLEKVKTRKGQKKLKPESVKKIILARILFCHLQFHSMVAQLHTGNNV